MTKQQQNKWNADAEASLMGFVIPIESREHLEHIVNYNLKVLRGQYPYDVEQKTKEVMSNAVEKYNSSKDKSVQWFTVNSTAFGVCFTFVRDKSKLTLKSGKPTNMGSLAWVENLDCPDCSELGYVWFENKNGKVHRIA